MVEKRDRHGIGEHALSGCRIVGDAEPRERRQGSEIAQAQVSRRAEDRRLKVVGTIDPGEKSRQLQLPNGEIESGSPEAGLEKAP